MARSKRTSTRSVHSCSRWPRSRRRRGTPALRGRDVAQHFRSGSSSRTEFRRPRQRPIGRSNALTSTSAGFELESARTARGWALVHQDRWHDAERELSVAEATPFDAVRAEIFIDIAGIHTAYGDRPTAETFVARALDAPPLSPVVRDVLILCQAELALRARDLASSGQMLERLALDRPHPFFAFTARARLAQSTVVDRRAGSPDASRDRSGRDAPRSTPGSPAVPRSRSHTARRSRGRARPFDRYQGRRA